MMGDTFPKKGSAINGSEKRQVAAFQIEQEV
jgi:hypothetical protein